MSNRSQLEFWRQTPQEQRLAISSIHVTFPAVGLHRIPAGFYVAVEVDGNIWKTTTRAEVPSSNVVQWDEIFVLPADNSAIVSLKIYAAYQFERMLGRGELMHEVKLTVGELLRNSNRSLPILFSPDTSGSTSTTSLLVKVARDIGDEAVTTQFGQCYSPGSDESQRLGQMTEIGQNFLVCYRRTRCISDYHAATEQLRLTLDYCGGDHPDRAAALTNLADALAIHPQIEESDSAINAPITLYQEALGLRQPGHPDHLLALQKLGLALLYRYNIRRNPADVLEGQELLNRAKGAHPDDKANLKPDIGTIRSADNSIPRSHRSSTVPTSTSPPSPRSRVSTTCTVSQPHMFPEALRRTADISTRSSPVSMSMVNGDSLPRHGQAAPSGDEKEFTAVSWDEIKAPSPACQSTQAPSHSGIPYPTSAAEPPLHSKVILSREGSARAMAPPADIRVMQPQETKSTPPPPPPLTTDPFLPLPMPAAQPPNPLIPNLCMALIAVPTSLFIILFMTRPSYLWL